MREKIKGDRQRATGRQRERVRERNCPIEMHREKKRERKRAIVKKREKNRDAQREENTERDRGVQRVRRSKGMRYTYIVNRGKREQKRERDGQECIQRQRKRKRKGD